MGRWGMGAGTIGVAMITAWLSAGPAPPDAAVVEPAVLSLREAAWRAWFAGDAATLTSVLPPEFIGIAWSDGPMSTREETIAASKAFHDGGGRLVRLAFPETRAQRFGDTVVLYGRFEIVLASKTGEQAIRGRLTETFVKRDGRWLHPGWHLDPVEPSAGRR